MADTDWPYDADQDHPMAARRLPVIRTTYPRWKYEVCICIADPNDPDPHPLWDGQEPTAEEWDLIEAALGYRMNYYRPGWAAKMRERPLDTDGSTNTVILVKRGVDDWCYRRATWSMGPPLWPAWNDEKHRPMDLRRLLDGVFGFSEEPFQPWEDWKARYPQLWPADDIDPAVTR